MVKETKKIEKKIINKIEAYDILVVHFQIEWAVVHDWNNKIEGVEKHNGI